MGRRHTAACYHPNSAQACCSLSARRLLTGAYPSPPTAFFARHRQRRRRSLKGLSREAREGISCGLCGWLSAGGHPLFGKGPCAGVVLRHRLCWLDYSMVFALWQEDVGILKIPRLRMRPKGFPVSPLETFGYLLEYIFKLRSTILSLASFASSFQKKPFEALLALQVPFAT